MQPRQHADHGRYYRSRSTICNDNSCIVIDEEVEAEMMAAYLAREAAAILVRCRIHNCLHHEDEECCDCVEDARHRLAYGEK